MWLFSLQNFLSAQSLPLNVDDDKIQRWHPRFAVDQVPDVAIAEIPKPPVVAKIYTAQEALAEARSHLTPKVLNVLITLGRVDINFLLKL